jgi:hypothetical protein
MTCAFATITALYAVKASLYGKPIRTAVQRSRRASTTAQNVTAQILEVRLARVGTPRNRMLAPPSARGHVPGRGSPCGTQ